jgi:hypothetical protein
MIGAFDESKLRIDFSAGAAYCWLCMTPSAAIEVHARAQAIACDGIGF